MADKIAKLLAKLPKKDLVKLKAVIAKIILLEYEGLDIKSLKGQHNIFRVRIGNYRIIFKIEPGAETEIISISRRNEKTYKDL